MASSGDTMVSGAEKDREHWRFVSVQTRGCLSVTRRSDKQREQQLQLAGYLAARECEVVGMGDTRLGGDASDMARLTRTALNGLYNNDTNIHNNIIRMMSEALTRGRLRVSQPSGRGYVSG